MHSCRRYKQTYTSKRNHAVLGVVNALAAALMLTLGISTPVAGDLYVLAGLPVNNTGCCRFHPGNPASNVVYMQTTPSICRSKCDIDESCVAYETVASQEKCELHFVVPDYTNTDTACRCWAKVPPTTSSTSTTSTASATSVTSTTRTTRTTSTTRTTRTTRTTSATSATRTSTTTSTTKTLSSRSSTSQTPTTTGATTTENRTTTSTGGILVHTTSAITTRAETPKPSSSKEATVMTTTIPTDNEDVVKHWSRSTTLFTVICVVFSVIALIAIIFVLRLNRKRAQLKMETLAQRHLNIRGAEGKRIHTLNIAFDDDNENEGAAKHIRESVTDGDIAATTPKLGDKRCQFSNPYHSCGNIAGFGRSPKRCDSNPYSVFHTVRSSADYEEPVSYNDAKDVYVASGAQKRTARTGMQSSPEAYDELGAYEEPVPLVKVPGNHLKHVVSITIPEESEDDGNNDYDDPVTPYDVSASVFNELLTPQPCTDPTHELECALPHHQLPVRHRAPSLLRIGPDGNDMSTQHGSSMKARFRKWLRAKSDNYDVIPRARSENYEAVALPPVSTGGASLKENDYDNPRAGPVIRQRSM